jgi:undecaprenyl-diphosphatase
LPLLHVLILAIVQGITEFLPVSSSGHLVLVWDGFDRAGWQVPENSQSDRLIMDVAVHVGTLVAVCFYFWRDIAQIVVGLAKLATGQANPGARLAFHIVAGSIPLVIVGLPGTSRSGITMTAARFLGFERPEAARFSLLLAIPAILGAGTLAAVDLYRIDDARLGFDAVVAAGLAFVVALLSIALMIRWLRRAGFTPFVIYRIALGIAILIWVA